MSTSRAYVMTLANSIIGVSVLAMPFCFKECGIVLSILMLILSSVTTRLACHYLIKAAVMARRRNYEFLAFHTFGPTGKFMVELCIIGFLLGTCIAFFVVMGDLGPVIIAKILNIENTPSLRPSVLLGLAAFVVLPLGLLRNVDSLTALCTISIGFYLCLVAKVIIEARTHLMAGDWLENVHLWRPSGLLQCIPIFSMALSCQTQVFEIYDSLPDASHSKMNEVVKAAVNICTGVYICVGFFGYVAFCNQNFSGNILLSFTESLASEIIKLCFVLSVAMSFPLVIFPCRASLYSLLFRRTQNPHELVSNHIPEARFKCITVFIVCVSLVTALLIPNIELVLGLVGSTIGTIICIMFPAIMFIRVSTKNTSERLLAQVIFFLGAMILILGTYANLYAVDKAHAEMDSVSARPDFAIPQVPKTDKAPVDAEIIKAVQEVKDGPPPVGNLKVPIEAVDTKKEVQSEQEDAKSDKRQEPPVPMEPAISNEDGPVKDKETLDKQDEKKDEKGKSDGGGMEDKSVKKSSPAKTVKKDGNEEIAKEAIKKEEEEEKQAESDIKENKQHKEHEEILQQLAAHEEEQKKIIAEQKQILEELKEHKKELVREKVGDDILSQDKPSKGDAPKEPAVIPQGTNLGSQNFKNGAEEARESELVQKHVIEQDVMKQESTREVVNDNSAPAPKVLLKSMPKVLMEDDLREPLNVRKVPISANRIQVPKREPVVKQDRLDVRKDKQDVQLPIINNLQVPAKSVSEIKQISQKNNEDNVVPIGDLQAVRKDPVIAANYQNKEQKHVPVLPPLPIKQLNNAIPIALANQGIINNDIVKSPQKAPLPDPVDILSENKVQQNENAAMRREILESGDVKLNNGVALHREKRDVETESNISLLVGIVNNQAVSAPLRNVPAEVGTKVYKAAEANQKSVVSNEPLVKSEIADNIPKVDSEDNTLIKSVAYLSNPEVPKKLESGSVPAKGPQAHDINANRYEEVKPMKRDLKFIQQNEKKQEI